MTNEDLLNDLKQFIAATVSQQTADIRGDISGIKIDISDIKGDIKSLDVKIDQVKEQLGGVADVVEDLHRGQEVLVKQGNEHGIRIERLEHKLA